MLDASRAAETNGNLCPFRRNFDYHRHFFCTAERPHLFYSIRVALDVYILNLVIPFGVILTRIRCVRSRVFTEYQSPFRHFNLLSHNCLLFLTAYFIDSNSLNVSINRRKNKGKKTLKMYTLDDQPFSG